MDQIKMRVKKRDGTLVPVRLDEITDRIALLSKELDQKIIDPVKITLEVVEKIHDGISTSLIDSFTAEICHTKTIEHPHFNVLASRLIIGDHQKTIQIIGDLKFSEVCKLLYTNTDQLGEPSPLISEELFSMSQENGTVINNMIVNERDFLLDYFGFKTLMKSYLLKVGNTVVETPQHMFMRVALGIHGKFKFEDKILEPDFELVKETYDLLSMKYFTHATPTLYNAGTSHPQLFSCFLLGMDDSLHSIYDTLAKTAQISKWSGGIGIHIHEIRANGSYIRGTGGKGDGIVPMLKVYNDTARYVNQGGKRSGSFAIYLEPWHADIQDFVKLGLKHGDQNRRATDLFYAIWIPDLFMERVQNNEQWSLMCPSECPGLANVYGKDFKKLYEKYEKEGRVVKTVNAQDLFYEFVKSQVETGTPYMTYKDAANYKSNQKNVGTIKSSNLCVAPETRILTKEGYYEIKDLLDKKIEVWNGVEWSETEVKQTGVGQKLIKITLSNGSVINCTEYHKFITEIGSRPADKSIEEIIEAKDLKIGTKLIKHEFPIITDGSKMKYAYTHGLFCSEGTYCYTEYGPVKQRRQAKLQLYGTKKNLLQYIDVRTTSGQETQKGSINVMLPFDLQQKYEVPINYCLESKLQWFEGVCDGDGSICKNGDNESIQVSSIHKDYLVEIQLMLQTIGVNSKVTKNKEERKELLPDDKEYNCKEIYRLLINSVDTYRLLELGFCPKRLEITKKEPQRSAYHFTKVISIEDEERYDDTYCFTESKRNRGIFEGVLLGNCSEIMEYSDTNKYACCVLASLVLSSYVSPIVPVAKVVKSHKKEDTEIATAEIDDGLKTRFFFDHSKLAEVVKVVTRNLNKLIDLNFYPVEETRRSNMSERPIGIGVQGLADVFFKLGLAYDSEEAIKLDKEIMETIYFSSLSASMELSKKDGPYATFKGSPISKGQFQFDLWKEFPTNKEHSVEINHSGRYDWDKLRKEIKKHGVRNSLVTALMPTATTSQIMGSASESFEPITSNCYTRRVKAGEFLVVNPYMTADLIKAGIWNEDMRNKLLATRGSLQNIPEIPQKLKDVYKTVWEIQQKYLIDHSVARGPYVDQSQSLNLYFADGNPDKITKAHFYGWKKGLKTGSYYIRTKPTINAASFTMEEDHSEKEQTGTEKSPMIDVANEEACTSCGS
jgi:ribonucleoside-diphosphate reductase alpha chain